MTDTHRRWDRLPTETPKSYAAFRVYCDLGARRSIGDAIQKTLKTLPSESQLVQWKRWSRKYHWVSRRLARAEWMARTADEDAKTYLHECYRALTTVAYKSLRAKPLRGCESDQQSSRTTTRRWCARRMSRSGLRIYRISRMPISSA